MRPEEEFSQLGPQDLALAIGEGVTTVLPWQEKKGRK